MFPAHIFKAYDIRGLVEGELSTDLAYHIGRAFVVFLRRHDTDLTNRSLVVGRDMRTSSGPFMAEVIRGITDEGVDVVDIGLVSTPLFNFACAHFSEHAGGIMVTASHNPAAYNGFKMTLGNGLPIGKNNGMDELRVMVETKQWVDGSQKGTVISRNMFYDYREKLLSLVNPDELSPKKVVIDFGNGMGGVVLPQLLDELPIQKTYLYETPDGTFPNHEANPLKTETLAALQQKVLEVGADFGFALDGDADRVGLVDERGQVVDASYVAALIGREVMKAHPGELALYDLRSSRVVKDTLESVGARTAMSMVGHALIKKMMKEMGAVYASELSLHLYFHDMYDVESSDLVFLYVVKLLSQANLPLSELVEPLKSYYHSGEINFEVHDKQAALDRIVAVFEKESTERKDIDGIWMGFEWGWFSVRESNTEPVLRLNLEAWNESVMRQKVDEVKALIEAV